MVRRMGSGRLVLLLLLALAGQPLACSAGDGGLLLLATTTSVRDSGLLEVLLPEFRAQTGVRVKLIAVGTGAALRMGAEGNVDVLLTHAPGAERELIESGAALSRVPIMENHFVIAGPERDPARVRDAEGAADAYRRMAAARVPYASRGDDSGTHKRERALLAEAGLDPEKGWEGFVQTGSGMGLTLQVAGERRAYALSDLGTFLAYRERVGLVNLAAPDPELRNVYSVLRIDPERFAVPINAEGAQRFEAFLVDDATQRRIERFGTERFGRSLFRPLFPSRATAIQTER